MIRPTLLALVFGVHGAVSACSAPSASRPVAASTAPQPAWPATTIYRLNAADEPQDERAFDAQATLEEPEEWIARAEEPVRDPESWIASLHARGLRGFDLAGFKTPPTLPKDTERLALAGHSLDVSRFPALVWLDAAATSPGMCAAAAALPSLVRLSLAETTADDACLERLAARSRLERLDLGYTKVTDAGVKKLVALPVLQALVLTKTQVTDAAISVLLDHFAFKRLDVGDTAVTKATKIARSTSLERLDLSATKVSARIVSAIVRHPYLQWLSLADLPIDDAALAKIVALRRLEALDLSGTQITSLTPLAQLGRLALLSLAGTSVNDLRPLEQLYGLRYLDLGRTEVTDAALRSIADLRNLHTLSLKQTAITDLSPIAGLAQLTHLVLEGVPAARFYALPSLVLLNVNDTSFADADLDALPTTLTALHLRQTKVTKPEAIARFARLRTLDVSHLPVTREHTLAWRPLGLRVLNASYTRLSRLAGALPQTLRKLYLVGVPLTAADLPPRAELRELEQVDLRETGVSDAERDAWLRR